jgi:hypothetical protein
MTTHERVYHRLLALYPAAFRDQFAADMVQLFGDQLRDARRAGAPAGSFRLWINAAPDLFMTAFSEQLRRNRTMAHSLTVAPSITTRALGMAGVIGGLILLAGFIGIDPDTNFVRLVLFNVGAIAIGIVVHRLQPAGSRRLSLAAVVPMVVANAWYAVMVLLPVVGLTPFAGDGHFVGFLVGVAMWLTDGIFGFVVWRTGVAARWVGLALAVGSLFALSGIDRLAVRGDLAWFFGPLALTGVAVNGLAWVLFGIVVATRRRPPASSVAGPSSS